MLTGAMCNPVGHSPRNDGKGRDERNSVGLLSTEGEIQDLAWEVIRGVANPTRSIAELSPLQTMQTEILHSIVFCSQWRHPRTYIHGCMYN